MVFGRVGASGLALALGLVAGCGDDGAGGGNTVPSSSGDAAASSVDTGETSTSGNGPVDTDSSKEVNTDDETPAPTPTSDSGKPVEHADGGGGGESEGGATCGGAGQECCAEATCSGGFVCVMEQPRPPVDSDAGLLAFDGGFANQRLGDGGLGVPPIDILPDGDAGLIAPPPPPKPQAMGMCEACGGEDQRCCAEDACDDGFTCEASGFRPNSPRSCVASQAPVGDGGDVNVPADAAPAETCGAEGQNCCAGGRGQDPSCDEGLECTDPPGGGLSNSECAVPASNNGADAAACGDEGQPCCDGVGDGCNVGLACESNPPRGIAGDLCVAQ